MNKNLYSLGKITNFYSYTDDMLDSLRISMELSLDLEALKLCRDACKASGQRDITIAHLRLLDEVFKATPLDASNASIAELFCSDQNIISTFNDLISKRSKLPKNKQAPLSLSAAANVCSDYLVTVGIEKPAVSPILDAPCAQAERDRLILSYLVQDAHEGSPIHTIASRLHKESFKVYDSAFEEYYLPTLKATLISLLDAIAYGYDRESLSIIFKYEFPKVADAKVLGDCLAVILGAYRVTCELCISDIPMISFTDNNSLSFEAEVLARYEKAPMPVSFGSKGATLYLLPFFEGDEGIPSFEHFRKACELYHSLTRTKNVLSARAVTGNLSDIIQKMSGDCYLVASEIFENIREKSLYGIVFESFSSLDGAISLGKIEQIEKTIVSNSSQNGELQQI